MQDTTVIIVSVIALTGLLGSILSYFQVIRYRETQLNYRTEIKARQAGVTSPEGGEGGELMQLLQYLPLLQQMNPQMLKQPETPNNGQK